jgi:hypothetical protein
MHVVPGDDDGEIYSGDERDDGDRYSYQMNKSTIIMPCNGSGFTDPQSTKGWAYVDFDWSNWKGTGSADGWVSPSASSSSPLHPKLI